jgi:hypothetical protein
VLDTTARSSSCARDATEMYRLIDGEWRIAHSNWAFTQTAEGAVAS